ncbi:MAG: MliC family protein [Hyphomonadaceae bacterium]
MKALIAVLGLATLAGCATPCSTTMPQRSEVEYSCANGARLTVAFDRGAGRALVSEDQGAAFDLGIQVSGQGFRYSGEGTALRGRGDSVEWTSPAGATTECTAIASRAMAQSTIQSRPETAVCRT